MAIDVYKEWLGIPDDQRPPDHYALLRLPQFLDDAEKIRKNYKKLNGHVRKYAAGQYSNESQALLNELAKAMLCLTDTDSKREYDRSLGREIDDRDETTGRRPLTAFLQDEGLVNTEQIREAKDHADRAGLTLRDALVQLKMVEPDAAARALASELGRSFVDLGDVFPEDDVLDQVPKSVARRFNCIPLYDVGDAILVACCDEPEHELEDEIRIRCDKPLRSVIGVPLAIRQAIAKYYADRPENATSSKAKKSAKPAKSTAGTAPKKEAARERVGPLSAEEKAERKQLGIVICCITFVLLANLDNWVLYDLAYKPLRIIPSFFPYVTTFLIGLPVIGTVYMTHIKGN